MALGSKLAYAIHNAGCWIEPGGEVGVWQAALIEFVCMFFLLFVVFASPFGFVIDLVHSLRFLAYGVGLDPRQAKLYGAKYGPVLVGLIVGLM